MHFADDVHDASAGCSYPLQQVTDVLQSVCAWASPSSIRCIRVFPVSAAAVVCLVKHSLHTKPDAKLLNFFVSRFGFFLCSTTCICRQRQGVGKWEREMLVDWVAALSLCGRSQCPDFVHGQRAPMDAGVTMCGMR